MARRKPKETAREEAPSGESAQEAPLARLVVGISGASGAILGIRLLQALRPLPVETHLIVSRSAELTIAYETDMKVPEVRALADASYAVGDLAAPISSGSFPTLGMVIAPCSIRTMAEIATGVTSSLLTRAADVTLKERRRLVLMLRETPLHTGHLRNLLALSEMGAVIAPPVPAFYARPRTIEEMVDHSVGRVCDLFGLDTGTVKRWRGLSLDSRRRRASAEAEE
jgi:4-hydroxy-3-polyprenylbenzoate decarboxylase